MSFFLRIATLSLVLVACSCPYSPAWAQDSGDSILRSVRFRLRPSNALVYQGSLNGNVHPVGQQGDKISVELKGAQAEGKLPTVFQFSVPQWFGGEYPNWGQIEGKAKDSVDITLFQLQVSKDELTRGQIPKDGVPLELALPVGVAFQAWTLAHPRMFFLTLLSVGLLIVLLRRVSLRRPERSEQTNIGSDRKSIGNYALGSLLGEGGMATVYRASSKGGEDQVAVKLLKTNLEDSESRDRFRREIQVLLKLSHANLMQLYDWGETEDSRPYLVCELLEGESLKQRLQTRPEAAPTEIVTILSSIAQALDYIHERGLVHRDVKPANVFLCSDGRVKLLDFGIARGADMAAVTQTGQVMGTPRYMSPEQVTGNIHPATDQYALGLIALELLSGSRLFSNLDTLEILACHAQGRIPALSSLVPGCNPLTEAAIRKMTSLQAESRFESLAAAITTLSISLNPNDPGDETAENTSAGSTER